MVEAVVCTSCPESSQDRVAEFCLQHQQHQVQKAFGKAGEMVNALGGKEWIPKWEAKVVMAMVTKAQTLNLNKALGLCITEAIIVMRRWPDNLRLLGQSKQRW